jgi:hypothetical protein
MANASTRQPSARRRTGSWRRGIEAKVISKRLATVELAAPVHRGSADDARIQANACKLNPPRAWGQSELRYAPQPSA